MLPRSPIKRTLRTETECNQISAEAVVVAKYTLEEIAQILAQRAGDEFERLNERRDILGIPRFKRLNAWAVRQAGKSIINELNNTEPGSRDEGVGSRGTSIMSPETDAAKSATKTNADGGDPGEL